MLKKVREPKLPILVGKLPVNLFVQSSIDMRFVSEPICEGKDPWKEFQLSRRKVRACRLPIVVGKLLASELPNKSNDIRASKFPIVLGRLPARLLEIKTMVTTLLAPPTVPHVTPVQTPGVVMQGL